MTDDEMVGCHHRLNGHELEKAPGDGERRGNLACCSPWNFPGKHTGVLLPFPTPGDLPNPGINHMSLVSPALAGRFFTIVPPGKNS